MSNTFNLCTYFPEKIKNLKKSTSKENQENHIKKIWLVFVWRVETAPAELYHKNPIKSASKKQKIISRKNGLFLCGGLKPRQPSFIKKSYQII